MKKFKCSGCAGCCVSKFPKQILDTESPSYKVISPEDERQFRKTNAESAVAHGVVLAKDDIKKINSLGLAPALRVARTLINQKTGKAEVSVCITKTPYKRKGSWVWACCFLNDKLKCDIYPKRPLACEAYPFILEDPGSGSHICFDDKQGTWSDYKTTTEEVELKAKYLKTQLFFESPLKQEEMITLYQEDPGKLNEAVITSIIGVSELTVDKAYGKIAERNRKRWKEFREFIITERHKQEQAGEKAQ